MAHAAGDRAARVRAGLAASADLRVDRVAERQRIRWSQAWPVLLRPTGDDEVHLVHGAGGPLGGDTLSMAVEVGRGARLRVRSAGATLVQPGAGRAAARWHTTIVLGRGARLDWAPEPTIVTDGAAMEVRLGVDAAAGARATVRELVVLGRHGQVGGRYRGTLTAAVDGAPLLAQTTVLDGADAALTGPGGTAGARAVGTLLRIGDPRSRRGAGEAIGVRWAWTALDGPGELLSAVGDPDLVAAVLDAAVAELDCRPE